METSRRDFLKTGVFALTGVSLGMNSSCMPSKSKEKVGLQLYTVREDMAQDPAGTLKKIADIGYKYVEHANYVDRKFYGYTPKEFKKILNDYGLDMISGHVEFG